jgi:vacuolar-type H+-ATPase subunit E/Vma4
MEILMPLEKLLARIMREAQEEYDRVVAQARAETSSEHVSLRRGTWRRKRRDGG